MNQPITSPKQINNKIPLLVLAIIALAEAIISFFNNMYYLFLEFNDILTLFFTTGDFYYFTSGASGLFNLLARLLGTAIPLVFLLYITFLYKKFSPKNIMLIIFVALALRNLWWVINDLNSIVAYSSFSFYSFFDFIELCLYVLAFIGILIKKNIKAFTLPAICVSLLSTVISIIAVLPHIQYNVLYFITLVASSALPIALLLFILTNNIEDKKDTINKYTNINIHSLPADQALRALLEQRNMGLITEEEYQAQRAIIISRL